MAITSVEVAANARTGVGDSRNEITSAKVNLPMLRMRSANRMPISGYATA